VRVGGGGRERPGGETLAADRGRADQEGAAVTDGVGEVTEWFTHSILVPKSDIRRGGGESDSGWRGPGTMRAAGAAHEAEKGRKSSGRGDGPSLGSVTDEDENGSEASGGEGMADWGLTGLVHNNDVEGQLAGRQTEPVGEGREQR
jgi:hypothetical protein